MTSHVHTRYSEDTEEPIDEREAARRRLRSRRDFSSHVFVYLVINAALVLAWGLDGMGYFWPGWVLGAWGVGLVFHAWDTYLRKPLTEADIDAEIERGRRSR